MPFQEIQYDLDDSIATITLDRPDKLNALTQQMEEELFQAMKQANEDPDVRVIVLTGAGKGFCAGADISLLQMIQNEDLENAPVEKLLDQFVPDRVIRDTQHNFQRAWSYFLAVEKPILAAINGPAVGLGFILTLYCDIRFAADSAKFGTAFSRRGLIAEHGISWLLPRLVGISNAFDLLYSARLIDAAEAQSMNLVSRVMPPETLRESTIQYAQELATQVSPRSLRMMKRELYQAQFQSLSEAIDQANQDMLESFSCNDFREGVAHFIEKRPPRFTGT